MRNIISSLMLFLVVFSSKGQNVGIGTNNPDSTLTISGSTHITKNTLINGTLKLPNGSGTGKILQSDSIGNANWVDINSISSSNLPYTQICGQRWTTLNLEVSTYRNGDVIPQVTDQATWFSLSTGAWCWYNNDSATYAATYGKLYNWYAVNDPRGLAPIGWHIPTNSEWSILINCLGGQSIAGCRMKFPGSNLWSQPSILGNNNNSTNISGFSAVESKGRGSFGQWNVDTNDGAYFWSSSFVDAANAYYFNLVYYNCGINKLSNRKYYGLSVRCIKD
jgi:uncharacterized protein (TIGR02145 family)